MFTIEIGPIGCPETSARNYYYTLPNSVAGILFNRLTPNYPYMGRTAPLTSKDCILYIYSTNIGTEYFKHVLYSQFFSSKYNLFHNANLFGSCIIHILYTGVMKFKKKNNSGAKVLTDFTPLQLMTLVHLQPFKGGTVVEGIEMARALGFF